MKKFIIGLFFLVFLTLVFYGINTFSENKNIEPIRELSYESNEELKPYIDKFFRDLNNHQIFPVIPKNFIVKFSDLESHKFTSHNHGVSLGYNDDVKVEIYINKRSWDSFNKTQKYYIVYHELSHDILNLDDLTDELSNYGKIMYPSISVYSSLKMNVFIQNMKDLFSNLN